MTEPVNGIDHYRAILAQISGSLDPNGPRGLGALVLTGKGRGSYHHENPWATQELTKLEHMVQALRDSGSFATLPRAEAQQLIDALESVRLQAGPGAQGGLGVGEWRLRDIDKHIEDLRKQWDSAARAAAAKNNPPVTMPGALPPPPGKR